MVEEPQNIREIIQGAKEAFGTAQHSLISTAFLRRPRATIDIKTAKQAMKFAQDGIKSKTPADVLKHRIRTSKYAKLVVDPVKMADNLLAGARRKVAHEKRGPAIEQARQQNRGRDQDRGFGQGPSR